MRSSSAIAVIMILAGVVGCSPELSQTPGISMKRDYSGNVGWWGPPGEWHILEELDQLAARTVSPEAKRWEGRIISWVDASDIYSVVICQPDSDRGLRLAEVIRAAFGIRAVRDRRSIPVQVLVRSTCPLRLQPTTTPDSSREEGGPIWLCCDPIGNMLRSREAPWQRYTAFTMHDLAMSLENSDAMVVLDETGLDGQYDFGWTIEGKECRNTDDALRRLGLAMKPAVRDVDAVFVERVDSSAREKLTSLKPGYQKTSPPWRLWQNCPK